MLHKSSFRFLMGVPLFNASSLVISTNIAINHIFPKTTFLGTFSVADSMDLTSITVAYWPQSYRARTKRKITATTPFKVIQGHRFQYQSKARMRLFTFYLALFPRYRGSLVKLSPSSGTCFSPTDSILELRSQSHDYGIWH